MTIANERRCLLSDQKWESYQATDTLVGSFCPVLESFSTPWDVSRAFNSKEFPGANNLAAMAHAGSAPYAEESSLRSYTNSKANINVTLANAKPNDCNLGDHYCYFSPGDGARAYLELDR